ncbi:putative transmembrane protein [Tieghemostelium lacteum]|uniref:Putative transmembrane protein n=1 Tax=Tieghemostelium lacteum TaxID=361077 RepID=A0A152A4H1_TIELA|nr:putative transmembrane protein [Tieghemostelium lacteum]|eukprot:KYR01142.1 putative transmembrane protein [Tieghemostelium lacteum]
MSSPNTQTKSGVSKRVKHNNTTNKIELDSTLDSDQNNDDNGKLKSILENRYVVYILKKLEWLFWVGLGTYIAYRTDLVNEIFYGNSIDRLYFNIGVIALFGFLGIYIYCAYFSGAKESNDWEKIHPKAIPIATILLVIFTFGFIIGCWSLWSFLTPVFLFIYFISVSYLV